MQCRVPPPVYPYRDAADLGWPQHPETIIEKRSLALFEPNRPVKDDIERPRKDVPACQRLDFFPVDSEFRRCLSSPASHAAGNLHPAFAACSHLPGEIFKAILGGIVHRAGGSWTWLSSHCGFLRSLRPDHDAGECRAIGPMFDRILPAILNISVSGPAGRFIASHMRSVAPQ